MDRVSNRPAGALGDATLDTTSGDARCVDEVCDEGHQVRFNALWYRDLSTGYSRWSSGFTQFLGHQTDELEDTIEQFLALIHPADRQDVEAGLRGSARWEVKHRLRLKSGEFAWFTTLGEPVRDDDGVVRRM